MIKIYTDGSCLKNPGPGGWGVIMIDADGYEWHLSEGEGNTTNNRMELQAIIEALNFVQGPEYIIYTDSELTMKCAVGIYSRKANKDLWEEYNRALDGRKLHWVWVKAHNGNLYNDYVDMLARLEAKSIKK